MIHNARKTSSSDRVRISRSSQPLPVYPPVDTQRDERLEKKWVVVEDVGQEGIGWTDGGVLIAASIGCYALRNR